MLSENIKSVRESRGFSQEELAIKLNVVRQTVSKWERGLSVPDADVLIALSEALDTPTSILLGETVSEPEADSLKVLAEKLEAINLQLAHQKEIRRKTLRVVLVVILMATALAIACLPALESSYDSWDFSDSEMAVVGTFLHAFEWALVRVAPLVLIGAVAGLCLTLRRRA